MSEREREREARPAGLRSSRWRLMAAAAIVLCGLTRGARGQCEEPEDVGQWTRAYSNFSAFTPSAQEPHFNSIAEIAHAVLLPPPHSGTADRSSRVVFIARSNCNAFNGQGGTANYAFHWNALDPANSMVRVYASPLGYQGTTDMFCSGHAVDADGNVVVGGGLNYHVKCLEEDECIEINDPENDDDNTQVGHLALRKLDTTVDPAEWISDEDWPALMLRERWYPTLTLLHDATIGIYGHDGAPSPECPFPSWPYGSSPENHRLRELFDSSTQAQSIAENRGLAPSAGCGSTPAVLSAGIYPRMHLLSSGQLLFPNATVPAGGHTAGPKTYLMNLETPPCGSSDLRWEHNGGAERSLFTKGSSTVHYVLLDSSSGTGLRDVVYHFGGIEGNIGDDDEPCDDPTGTATTDQAWRHRVMSGDPGEHDDVLAAGWTEVASMCSPRVNQNAIALPTGATLIVGGSRADCAAVQFTEEFHPAEIFGTGPADTGIGTWLVRASQTQPRLYHSVALLLPDGRVMSAGGNAGSHTYHSIDIYSPPYVFSGSRPQITGWPLPAPAEESPITYLAGFEIDATLAGGSSTTVDRIVLIRSGASSHAFDMNQRYVELEFTLNPGGSYPNFSYTVQGPRDGFAAPPGYYLLFAVDSNGLPSVGRWVRVAEA